MRRRPPKPVWRRRWRRPAPTFESSTCWTAPEPPICVGGTAESVQRLVEEDVNVLFPTVNAITLPAYITEMVTQGFEPGDVRFYNFRLQQSRKRDRVEPDRHLRRRGGRCPLRPARCCSCTATRAATRLTDYAASMPFDDMCMREYAENSPIGEYYDPRDPAETNKARHGGPRVQRLPGGSPRALRRRPPTPAGRTSSRRWRTSGPVDLVSMLPGSLAPGKWTMGDSLQPVTFRYPCPFEGMGHPTPTPATCRATTASCRSKSTDRRAPPTWAMARRFV